MVGLWVWEGQGLASWYLKGNGNSDPLLNSMLPTAFYIYSIFPPEHQHKCDQKLKNKFENVRRVLLLSLNDENIRELVRREDSYYYCL